MDAPKRGVRVVVNGRVQGVGFRAFVADAAGAEGLAGWVRNRRNGAVEAVVYGQPDAIERWLKICRAGPAYARVDDLVVTAIAPGTDTAFTILPTI